MAKYKKGDYFFFESGSYGKLLVVVRGVGNESQVYIVRVINTGEVKDKSLMWFPKISKDLVLSIDGADSNSIPLGNKKKVIEALFKKQTVAAKGR